MLGREGIEMEVGEGWVFEGNLVGGWAEEYSFFGVGKGEWEVDKQS